MKEWEKKIQDDNNKQLFFPHNVYICPLIVLVKQWWRCSSGGIDGVDDDDDGGSNDGDECGGDNQCDENQVKWRKSDEVNVDGDDDNDYTNYTTRWHSYLNI